MGDRLDHSSRLGGRNLQAPTLEETELPLVGPGLIEHLERQFPRQPPELATSLDHMVARSSVEAFEKGIATVLQHLRTLIKD